MSRRGGLFWLLAFVVGGAPATFADNKPQGYRDDNWWGTDDGYEAPWTESESVLPPAPLAENFTPITSLRLPDDYEYVIDRMSLSLQADEVFRYTVVIRAPTGVSNGFYEGIHCETREFKIYGYLIGGQFQKSGSSNWQPIPRSGLTVHREVLLDEFVCNGHSRPGELNAIRQRFDENVRAGWTLKNEFEGADRE